MKLSLVVQTEGKQKGKVLDINLAQFVIGRDPQCHLRPASPLISKRHCAILRREGKAFLRDFESTNGTIVNDQPVKGEIELQDGDRLTVGPLLFEVRLQQSAPVDKPTPMPAGMNTPTPAPAAKAAAPKGAAASDDEIAALLLGDISGEDGGAGNEVPEGSTVLDLVAMQKAQGEQSAADTAKNTPDKKPERKSEGDTRSAADAILKKYMRRPRT